MGRAMSGVGRRGRVVADEGDGSLAAWFGGLLAASAFALAAMPGAVHSGLWHVAAVAVTACVTGALLSPRIGGRGVRLRAGARK